MQIRRIYTAKARNNFFLIIISEEAPGGRPPLGQRSVAAGIRKQEANLTNKINPVMECGLGRL
jgi:hypothetical protein